LSPFSDREHYLRSVLLAIAVVALAWGAVPWGTFQFDDFRNVVRDPATTDAVVLLERLQHGLRPLTRLSYFLDARLYGGQAAGFLSTNLLLHTITVLLVFALARRRVSAEAALIAAMLFAIQPANAEVVAYISGRSTGLMTPLLLGGLLLYDKGKTLAALALFVLACLAKEHAIIFPALVLAWELTRKERRPTAVRNVVLALLVAGAVAVALLLNVGAYQKLVGDALADKSIGDSLIANARALPEMVSLWVRPWALSADHAFDDRLHLGASVAGFLFLVSAVVVAVVFRRRWPLMSLAIAWALIALLPANSILFKPDLVTEKPLYLAWFGPSLALGAALLHLFRTAADRTVRHVYVGVCTLVAVAFIGAGMWRVSLWRDPVALWSDAAAKAPYKSRCWNNLGMANLAAGREAEAVMAFSRAVYLDPRNEYAAMNLLTARALCGDKCPGS
jgi:hypothetical protein